MLRELHRNVRNNRHEFAEEGKIYVPQMRLFIGGVFTFQFNDDPKIVVPNLFTNEGLNHILDRIFNFGAAVSGSWYMGLIDDSAGAPQPTWTAGDASSFEISPARYTERQTVSFVADTPNNAVNASPVAFTIVNAGTVNVSGGYLISSQSGDTGVLMSAATFASGTARPVDEGDALTIQYSITAADA